MIKIHATVQMGVEPKQKCRLFTQKVRQQTTLFEGSGYITPFGRAKVEENSSVSRESCPILGNRTITIATMSGGHYRNGNRGNRGNRQDFGHFRSTKG
jgi:hypothetical protein